MGTYTIGETKVRPGVYNRIENGAGTYVVEALNGIGAGLIRANWGPLNEAVTVDPSTNVNSVFGSGLTQDLITEMFKASITKGYYVRVGTGGTAASIILKDSATANVVTITAKYVGDRAFAVSIRDSLSNTSKRECIIYDGVTEFEKIEFAKGSGEVDAIVSAFSTSSNFTASKIAAGSGILAVITQSAFTAGTNPTTDSAAYSAALSKLESYKFNSMAVDTEDASIHALVGAFINRIYVAGAFPLAVLAESKTIDIDTRISHAADFNNAKIHYVLNPANNTSGNIVDGYKLAARIAGYIAAVPSDESITHLVISDFGEVAEPLTNTQIESAIKHGCIVLSTNAVGQVWIEQGINTLITPSGNEDEGWKKIRRVKTRFELMDRVTSTLDLLTGKIDNDADGRAAMVAAGQSVIDNMIREKKLVDGSLMYEDDANPPSGDSVWFTFVIIDIDSVEKVYLTWRFQFSANN